MFLNPSSQPLSSNTNKTEIIKNQLFVTDRQDALCIGLLLPEDSKRPLFIRIPKEDFDDEGHVCIIPGYSQIIDLHGFSYYNQNVVRNYPLNFYFEIVYKDAFLKDGSKPNKSVNEITRGKAGLFTINLFQGDYLPELACLKSSSKLITNLSETVDVGLLMVCPINNLYLRFTTSLCL